ncbi:hypothetical protein BDZ91DRAFT_754954 [Kalaharituber pfeilii]|nr:hypothetical protein BDZ91DRAFT_754954 [Kalaharituber pfeilii]
MLPLWNRLVDAPHRHFRSSAQLRIYCPVELHHALRRSEIDRLSSGRTLYSSLMMTFGSFASNEKVTDNAGRLLLSCLLHHSRRTIAIIATTSISWLSQPLINGSLSSSPSPSSSL